MKKMELQVIINNNRMQFVITQSAIETPPFLRYVKLRDDGTFLVAQEAERWVLGI